MTWTRPRPYVSRLNARQLAIVRLRAAIDDELIHWGKDDPVRRALTRAERALTTAVREAA